MEGNQTKPALRFFMWIVPRSNSTALAKCMSFVDDTVVWFEPYMTSHMNDTYFNPEFKKGDPSAEQMRAILNANISHSLTIEILNKGMTKAAQWPNLHPQEQFTRKWVKEQLEICEKEKFIFIKDQASAIFDHLDKLPVGVPTRHAFLIRHPQEVYTSWKNGVTRVEVGADPMPWHECHAADDAPYIPVPEFFQIQYKLWKHVKEHIDPEAIVIDGHDLANSPDVILPKLFEKVGIPFKESYLEWSSDPEEVFSQWRGSAEMIILPTYSPILSRAMNSTKFEPPKRPRGVSNPEWAITAELKEYIEGAMPFYEEMYANRLA